MMGSSLCGVRPAVRPTVVGDGLHVPGTHLLRVSVVPAERDTAAAIEKQQQHAPVSAAADEKRLVPFPRANWGATRLRS